MEHLVRVKNSRGPQCNCTRREQKARKRHGKRKSSPRGEEERGTPDSLISAIPSSTTPGLRMADKRQLNLNHEYERAEREKERKARRGEAPRLEEERQRKPRRQSGGSFVTVMASTPSLRPPRLAPLLVYR
ncbi:hypothetical protein QLX08_006263 [Tetragonisca angustula]|uniref:Uncharacterized protein n=1 Tax=Tetragonisca angustula TaxID=166442 RepID=A0AAW0ZV49_9HYME